MEVKKIFSKIVLILITIAIALSVTTTVKAAKETTMYLGLEEFRKSGYAYKAAFAGNNGKLMWKISSYEDSTGTGVNKEKTIYCIKAGPGFGSSDMGGTTESNGTSIITYNQYFDLKKYSDIPQEFRDVLPSGEDYNALIWVLEHCYIPTEKTAETDRQNLLSAAGVTNTTISDDEIDIAQQIAIWHFTNRGDTNYDYKINNDGRLNLEVSYIKDKGYKSIIDMFDGGDFRLEDTNKIIKYLIENGEKNKNTESTTSLENTVTIEETNAIITNLDNDNYLVGPYKLKTSVEDFSAKTTLKDASKNSISHEIVDKNGKAKNLKKDSNFYLKVPKIANIDKAKLTVDITITNTTITYWNSKTITEQPVVELKREPNTVSATVTLKSFDLALRKFIVKINNNEVNPSREPKVSAKTIEELANGNITTVTKEHTKDPIVVKKGDTVLYTIRVYNEGEIDGYVKEITDYLPDGLKFIEDSAINTENGWTNPSKDGKTLVTTKCAEKLLNKFNGKEIDYVDVQIECLVDKKATDESINLKNVAEITKHSDSEGNEKIKDIDSTPNNLTDAQKQKYNPGTSTQGWGYEDDDDYEDLLLPASYFDLALRKYITSINGKELINTSNNYIRQPNVDVTNLANGTSTTAEYKHRKDPVGVSMGDIVIYTLRVYNEGELDGYASEVTDYLPPELEFVIDDEEEFNAGYGWLVSENGRSAKTSKLSKENDKDNLIKAFDKETMKEPDYKELKIKCRVKKNVEVGTIITNIAEITKFTNAEGNAIIDRDSKASNVTLPIDENLSDYKGNTANKSVLTDTNYHYKGQEDDDDFEKLVIQVFDLALRKFITGVNETPVTNRIPVFTKVKDKNGNYVYEHTKEPIEVETSDIVEYTIRVYNEGDIAGYAKEIKDDIPYGLEFLPANATNIEYRWKMLDADGKETLDPKEAKYITTDYRSKAQEKTSGENLIKPFDIDTMQSPFYKDVKVAFKVVAPGTYSKIITNIAEISDDSDENDEDIEDIDSTPNNNKEDEDDIDVEHIKLSYFDLALRKFITAVNEDEVTNRVPQFKITEDGKYVYEHTKEPVEVKNKDIVTYTIRVFNEGTKNGYAKEVKDDLPEGLEFLPENKINTEYRWVMLDKDDKETDKIEEAVSIKTDYLSKEQEIATGRNNLLKAFDEKNMKEPDYRDVKIAFKVTEPETSDRILINKAQISDDSKEDGSEVTDIDSTPNKWIEGEDDQDIEKVKVKYFDLALRKWVTEAIVIQDGKETVTQTGHKAEDDPEEVVKVEIVESKLKKVVVKFRYKIRVTNEGEIEGYVDEISDYIPEGLKFVPAENPLWKETDEERKVTTDQLKDTLLKPGESAEVEILLTWINGKDNMGLKVNVAEISKDRNDSDSKDIDSTPNNKKEGEDDIDDAPVILTIKTGKGIEAQYIALALGTVTILGTGIFFIKKYVL